MIIASVHPPTSILDIFLENEIFSNNLVFTESQFFYTINDLPDVSQRFQIKSNLFLSEIT